MHRDWVAWHRAYDEPGSPLARRLTVVRGHLRRWLDIAPAGPLRAISICAGEARDVLPVLADHPRGTDVKARLVELDPINAAAARREAREGVEVVEGDASTTDAYTGAVPADLIVACGVFGNISDDDVRRTVSLFPMLAAPRATVVWTRHRRTPDKTNAIREWFAEHGFAEVEFDAPDDDMFAVGVHRLVASPMPFEGRRRLFTFVGH